MKTQLKLIKQVLLFLSEDKSLTHAEKNGITKLLTWQTNKMILEQDVNEIEIEEDEIPF